MEQPLIPARKQHHQLLRIFQELKHQDFPDMGKELVDVGLYGCRARAKSGKKEFLSWVQSRLLHFFALAHKLSKPGGSGTAVPPEEEFAWFQSVWRGNGNGWHIPCGHEEVFAWLESVLRGTHGRASEGGVTFEEWRHFLSAVVQDYLGGAIFTPNPNKQGNGILRQIRSQLQEALRTVPKFPYAPDYCARENRALERLENMVNTTLTLARDMANATPPGTFVLPRKGDAFDEQKQEPLLGCPGTGSQVLLRLFPAYEVVFPSGKKDLVEKARVFTFVAKKRKTNISGTSIDRSSRM